MYFLGEGGGFMPFTTNPSHEQNDRTHEEKNHWIHEMSLRLSITYNISKEQVLKLKL